MKLKPEEPRAAQVRKRQDLFLTAFRKVGTISGAAVKSKVSRECVRQWRHNDAAFEERFQDCDLDVTGMLEDSAVDDALGQLDEKTGRYKGGDPITRIFLLKSRNPKKYRENISLEHSGGVTLRDLVIDDPKGKKS